MSLPVGLLLAVQRRSPVAWQAFENCLPFLLFEEIHIAQVRRRTGEQSLQRSLALDQRRGSQIKSVEAKQIESPIDETVGARMGYDAAG